MGTKGPSEQVNTFSGLENVHGSISGIDTHVCS